MKERLEAGYATVMFGLMFFLGGFLANIAASWVYDHEKNSPYFMSSVMLMFIVFVGSMCWFLNFLEKKLTKNEKNTESNR